MDKFNVPELRFIGRLAAAGIASRTDVETAFERNHYQKLNRWSRLLKKRKGQPSGNPFCIHDARLKNCPVCPEEDYDPIP